ncbi:hypothetical protein PYW07_015629 [Mythimna separata]|uniref:Ig-like domain-containing protein n=1 Tax=Mythimna separata TaxID=271217 RepID=A0AAD7YXP6_MYTSE|nr:hypothetical protein PYW07_015629 [Mythimna separata]
MLAITLLLAACAAARARVFNITYLDVPEVVRPGQEEVEIECRYDANFTLLSWFKGSHEFFRYKPGAAPSTRSFPIPGIGTVEMSFCGPVACMLKLGALTEEATGLYRCDIERDVPPYRFATMTAHMEVQGHDHRQPLLEGVAAEYKEGDMIEAYCRAAPDSELRWYINGQEYEEFRNSPHFKKRCTRFMFMGVPLTMLLQCAEFRYGHIYGSVAKKADWFEIGDLRKRPKQNEVENGSSVITGTIGLLSTLLCFLVKVIYV